MRLNQSGALRSASLRSVKVVLAVTAGASIAAQQFPGYGTANYNWSVPYGSLNYNYGFMRYGVGSAGASPSGPTMQPQYNGGTAPAPYGVYGMGAAGVYQGANQNIPDAAMNTLQNQNQMPGMELRYDVRKKTPRTMQPKGPQANKLLALNQVLSSEGKVLWPVNTPGSGELGKSRAAAESAIKVAFQEFKDSGKASVHNVVEAKERLYAYGHPALNKAASQGRQSSQRLLQFLSSLEHSLDSLGGV